jgi:DHA1 family bicyclomycin/chloramphenicol resistance-like MFS transporter
MLSKSLSFMGIVALLSPILGGVIKDSIGWQYCFAMMGLYATTVMLVIVKTTPETIHTKSLDALHFGPLFKNYLEISQHKIFLLYALVSTGSYSALMIFFVKSPVLLIKEFGFNPFEFGLTIALCSVGFIVGTFIGRRLLGFQALNKALLVGATIAFSATVLMVLLTQTTVLTRWGLGTKVSLVYIGCQITYMLGHGILQPISQSAAIGPFPTKAGAAGAVLGFIIHTGAALWIAGFEAIPPASAWPVGICLAASIIFFASLVLHTRSEPR